MNAALTKPPILNLETNQAVGLSISHVPNQNAKAGNTAMLQQLLEWQPAFSAIRRTIHANPELGHQETNTARIIAQELRAYGLEVSENIGSTGVVGVLHGSAQNTRPGNRRISLRADMDALALIERTSLPHSSRNPGKMHACGHDGHTTMLLAAARYLSQHRNFAGIVNFIFQPAEEGLGGAEAMINDNLFERFPADAIYGLHNAPELPLGTISTRPGALMAAAGMWTTTFEGTGGHGGLGPHLATDTSIVLAQFILGIQTIVSRNIESTKSAVLSIGHILGGSPEAPAVMPSSITVGGTMRCFDPGVRETLDERLPQLATTLSAAFDCQAATSLTWVMPALINHERETDVCISAARRSSCINNVCASMTPVTSGDDFAFMLQKCPGAIAFIGTGHTNGQASPPLHSPHYDFNDDAIAIGAEYWINVVHQELIGEQQAMHTPPTPAA